MKLTDIVDRINGNVDRFTTELEYYIGGEHFESNELEVTQKGLLKENLGKLGFKFHFAFQDRDVVFMARNPHLRKAGMVRFAGLCSDASYILRSKDETVLSQEYLAVMLQSDHFWDYCESHKVGSVNFANNWSSIANYEFELPTPEEQKEISDKVWAAYRLKESYKKLLAATEEMVKSQFIEMFGSSAERVALSSLCDTFIDGDWIEAKDQSDSGIRLIQTGNVGVGTFKDKGDKARYISEETFNRLNCTEVVEEDILISRLPDPVGRACIIPAGLGKSITAVDCTIIRLNDKVLPKFFVAFTNTPDYAMQIKKVLSGTTRLRVSRANLGKIQIPIPSKEEQQQFVTKAEQADKSEFELRKSIKAIDAVIKSLINENL
ncbi:MAG: restriction endonuclease subunit S [Bacteroidaceae bacterium]|nr:restriction endonuclease subunit S [Bacteroidaceae bacterium]